MRRETALLLLQRVLLKVSMINDLTHSFTISGRCDHFQVDSVKYVSLKPIDRVISFHKLLQNILVFSIIARFDIF